MGLSQSLCSRMRLVGEGLSSKHAYPRILAGRGQAVTLHIPTWWHLTHEHTHHTRICSQGPPGPTSTRHCTPLHTSASSDCLVAVSPLHFFRAVILCLDSASSMKPPLISSIRSNHWTVSHCPCLFILWLAVYCSLPQEAAVSPGWPCCPNRA